jgi:hypothetical protein
MTDRQETRRLMETLERGIRKLTDDAITTLAFASTEGLTADRLRERLVAIRKLVDVQLEVKRTLQEVTDGRITAEGALENLAEIERVVAERYPEEDDEDDDGDLLYAEVTIVRDRATGEIIHTDVTRIDNPDDDE